MLLGKNESSLLKNKKFHGRMFFSSEWKSSKKKESLHDGGSDTKFSYQTLDFHVRSHKKVSVELA